MSHKKENKMWLKGTLVSVGLILLGGMITLIGSGAATTIAVVLILIGVAGLVLTWILWNLFAAS